MNSEQWFEILDMIKSALSGNGRYKINSNIRYYTNILRNTYNYDTYKLNNLKHEIAIEFVSKYYERHKPEECKLQVYINGFVLISLKALVRKLKKDVMSDSISYDVVEDYITTMGIDDYDVYNEIDIEQRIVGEELFSQVEKLDSSPDKVLSKILFGELTQYECAKNMGVSRQAVHDRLGKFRKEIIEELDPRPR